MAPDSEQCERGAARGGGRVLPGAAPAPAPAWPPHSPAESRRLLPAAAAASLQAGLTLGVWPARTARALLAPDFLKPEAKTKSQKRKERIIAALRPPYFILSLIIVITAVHVWGGARAAAALQWAPARWWRQPWRLLSYGCVHASDAHLALNALVALAVGWRLEREQGAWRCAALCGAGAAAGALGAGALQPRMRVVGASAAVYALLTAHLPNVAYRYGHIPLWWFRPLSVVVLAASEGCWALLRPPAPRGQVAWSAHIFGAAVGVPVAFLVFTGENKSSRWLAAARALSALALVALGALAGAYYGACAALPEAPAPAPSAVRELQVPPHHL